MADQTFWRNRRVFITGCTGILGSWLTPRLVELGADVVGLVRDWVPNSLLIESGAINRITIVRGGLTDPGLLDRIFAEYDIDTCFHLAAITTVGISNRAPLATFETNIRGTWLLLEAARRWPRTGRVIVASSDKAYGEHSQLPYTEDMALNGLRPYEVSKSCADMLARTYATTYSLPVAVTRCANLYGGGDLNWNRIVPGTIRSVYYDERPVIRSDGSPLRDYLYVEDVVDAYLTLAEAMADGAHTGAAFNFGQAHPVSALEMVQTIIELSGKSELTPIIQNQASGEIQNQYLASDKAHQQLGWQPRYTFKQGLQATIDWYHRFLSAA